MITQTAPAKRVTEAGRYRKGHSAESECRRVIAYKATVVKRRLEPQRRFLAAYGKLGAVTYACQAAGIYPSTFYRWKRDDEEFAQSVRALDDEVTDRLEAEAHRRAMARSDTLLIFLLKARRPEVYRERRDVTVEGGLTLSTLAPDVVHRLSDEELAEARRIIAKLRAKPGEELGQRPAALGLRE